MNVTKILKYQLRDHLRSRWALFYTLFFLVLTEALLRFAGTGSQTVLSLMNVVLIVTPLVGLVFGVMYLYNSREFNVLLLSQPINRSSLYWGLYVGLALSLSAGFALGAGVPFALRGILAQESAHLLLLLVSGILLTLIFIALAFVIAVRVENRVTGVALALLAWLFFCMIYDGLILLGIFLLADYPLEKPVLVAGLLNPVDLARILTLLNFDVATLMGYTGAAFQRFFGSGWGAAAAVASLLLWVVVPLTVGVKLFQRKDF